MVRYSQFELYMSVFAQYIILTFFSLSLSGWAGMHFYSSSTCDPIRYDLVSERWTPVHMVMILTRLQFAAYFLPVSYVIAP